MKRGKIFGGLVLLALIPFVIGELDSSETYSQNFYIAIMVGIVGIIFLVIFFFFFFRKPRNSWKDKNLIEAPQKKVIHSKISANRPSSIRPRRGPRNFKR